MLTYYCHQFKWVKKFSIANVKYLYTNNGAYGIICVKTNALTTNLFILAVIIPTLKMEMDESNKYYATEVIDLDEKKFRC